MSVRDSDWAIAYVCRDTMRKEEDAIGREEERGGEKRGSGG